jgi:hypothetical protein
MLSNCADCTIAPRERMKVVGEMWRIAKGTDEAAKYSAMAATMQRQEDNNEQTGAQKQQRIMKIGRQLSNLVCIPYSA